MAEENIVNERLPDSFRRYPCPQSNSSLEGTVEVDLGEWRGVGPEPTDFRRLKLHLRVNAANLPKLLKSILENDGRTKTFGFGALQVFVVAATVKTP
jgi:hypothetical protein